MELRIGRIPYLNAEPFFRDDSTRTDAIVASPREMLSLAVHNQVDIAPLPVVAEFDFPDKFLRLSNFGIASFGPAYSVILKSKATLGTLAGCQIGIIDETSTSVRLLKVLLEETQSKNSAIRFGPIGPGNDAILLIGDKALGDARPSTKYPVVLDLADEWKKVTGLPFVFALWYTTPEVSQAHRDRIGSYLGRNLTANLADLNHIQQCRSELNMGLEQMTSYIRSFIYRLNDAEFQGLEHFRKLDFQLQQRVNAA